MGAVVQFRAKEQAEEAADTILLTAVMESCAEGLAIVESGRVLRANRAFAKIFGYVEGPEIEGRPLFDFVPESLFLFSPDPKSPPQASECAGKRRDGEEVPIVVACAIFRSSQRELQVVNVCSMEQPKLEETPADSQQAESPAGDMRELERRKLESQRLEAMGRVVGGVAHDFNNLLTGILLYCDLLIRGLEPDSPLRAYVEEIRKAGGHSSGLILQLLSAARPQKEEASANSWSDIISGMQILLTRMLGETIELVFDLDPHAAPVGLSETAMRQIVLNLLLNSRDAMPEGGQITLAARNCADCVDTPSELLDGYVELTVADTGCGMDAVTRARVFERFFTTKAAGQGNGVGLATVQRIVSEANGSLELQSEPKQGTRVFIRLPQAQLPQVDLSQVRPPEVAGEEEAR